MKHALERAGDLDVEHVGTGAAALKSVMEEPPSLVLLDLNLPYIDGVEVCRLLRGRAPSAAIPIIIVTARAAEMDRIAGLEIGADDYVTKPFSLRELVARVRAVDLPSIDGFRIRITWCSPSALHRRERADRPN